MKHNDTVIRQYCRAVGKKLPLPAAQRRQLLAGLQEELAESAPDCAALDELITQVGKPDETAQELLSGIAPERIQAYQKKQRWRYILIAVLIAAICGCSMLYYCQRMMESSVAYAQSHIEILPTTDLTETEQSHRR